MKEERGTYQDDEKTQMIRMGFTRLHDHKLRAFYSKSPSVKTQEEFLELAKKVNFDDVPKEDLIELFFAMGADGMSVLIYSMLPRAKTDADLDCVAYLSALRNGFYSSVPAVS